MATPCQSGRLVHALVLGALSGIFVACTTVPPPLLTRHSHRRVRGAGSVAADAAGHERALVVSQARRMLDGAPLLVEGLQFEPDPIGFVRAAYWAAGVDLFDPTIATDPEIDGMTVLFRSASARRQLHGQPPRPGDLAFFDASPGAVDLYPVQVGIVESTTPAGTVTVVGSFASGPTRIALNLRNPEITVSENGATANTLLASNRRRDATAAQLFRSFADPF